jgi:dihydropteroate synthase
MEPRQLVSQVKRELQERLQEALEAGVESGRVVLDPGFGFGKVYDQNYRLIAGLEELAALGQPLLAGVSRKGFLGRTLSQLSRKGEDAPVDRRGNASLAALTATILAGAQVVRVHDVRPAREAATIADAILEAAH